MRQSDVIGAPTAAVADERRRIHAEYQRRERDIEADRYAAWQPAVLFERAGRLHAATRLLRDADRFPRTGDRCLEVGFGAAGWLTDLLSWGVIESDVHGIELDAERAARASRILPAADLRVGDATDLPWSGATFALVVISTVFSSILDERVQQLVAAEAWRVTAPGGAVLVYDLRTNNPANANVRRVDRRDISRLFPGVRARHVSVTLAPPVARWVAPRSRLAAQAMETMPFLRTHLMTVLTREGDRG